MESVTQRSHERWSAFYRWTTVLLLPFSPLCTNSGSIPILQVLSEGSNPNTTPVWCPSLSAACGHGFLGLTREMSVSSMFRLSGGLSSLVSTTLSFCHNKQKKNKVQRSKRKRDKCEMKEKNREDKGRKKGKGMWRRWVESISRDMWLIQSFSPSQSVLFHAQDD